MDNLNVPMKYKFETRIGNWNEESQLEEHKLIFLLSFMDLFDF